MRKTALVVDDSTSMRQMVAFTLQSAGFKTIEGGNGVEALAVSANESVDLVVTDLNMPEMDGITAAREIRKLWPQIGPKIIAVTAYALKGDRERCLEAGMDDYISKPIQKKELEAILLKYSAPANSRT
jgi:CheY-like chemotaxis protein